VQRTALLDHELCHAAVKLDKHGETTVDARGRVIYRTRKHDLEEFSSIVERHGLWTSDLERFAAALRKSQEPFKPCEQCQDSPGWIRKPDQAGVERLSRCACWVAWSEHRSDVRGRRGARVVSAVAARPNCRECRYRRDLPGSAHSKCVHPNTLRVHANPTAGMVALLGKRSGLTLMPLTPEAQALTVVGHEHGIRHGWFLWPVNYDPTWLEHCDGFTPLEQRAEAAS
jgi:hypothetical protein